MAEKNASFDAILARFRPVFNRPTFVNFVALVLGWVLAPRRGLPSEALAALDEEAAKHFSAYYRFFSRAVWDPDELGTALLRCLLLFVPDAFVTVVLDDTVAHKHGKKLWGGNVHHDPLGFGKKAVCFGHCWVTLAIVIYVPGMTRPVAVPVYWRLYRSKKKRRGKNGRGKTEAKNVGAASEQEYRTRPELAVEMLHVLREVLGDRPVRVLGDSLYGGKSVARNLPPGMTLVSRLPMDAALFDLPPARRKGQKGPARKKGDRCPAPQDWAQVKGGWKKTTVRVYGHTVAIRYKTQVRLGYRAAGPTPVRIVLVRDPRGKRDDDCFYTTDTTLTPEQVVEAYGQRWALEVAFRDGKQLFGFERPQGRTRKAVERTAPFAFVVYGLVVTWFAEAGHTRWKEACRIPRYYGRKTTPSVADMLKTLRVELLHEQILAHPDAQRLPHNCRQPLKELIKMVA